MTAEQWPTCGVDGCFSRAWWVNFGVGLCDDHREGDLRAKLLIDFDPWWRAAMAAGENGDPAWVGLEYGEWPEGRSPPADARPGWGLPPTEVPDVR